MMGDNKGLKVTYEDFLNMHFCIGEVIECTEVRNSKKLLVFKVRIGEQTRQIVSSLRDYCEPQQMIGKKVTVLTNLEPIIMGGMPSEGVILSAEDKNGVLSLIVPEKEVEVGAEVC